MIFGPYIDIVSALLGYCPKGNGPIVSMVKHRTPNAQFEVRVLVGPHDTYKYPKRSEGYLYVSLSGIMWDEKNGLKPLYERSELWRGSWGREENCVAILTRDRVPHKKQSIAATAIPFNKEEITNGLFLI